MQSLYTRDGWDEVMHQVLPFLRVDDNYEHILGPVPDFESPPKSLEDAFNVWGFFQFEDIEKKSPDDEDLWIWQLKRQELGYLEMFLETIAPFVQDGGRVDLRFPDDESRTRYRFYQGKCYYCPAEITFPQDPCSDYGNPPLPESQ